jgi:hypothetical protein
LNFNFQCKMNFNDPKARMAYMECFLLFRKGYMHLMTRSYLYCLLTISGTLINLMTGLKVEQKYSLIHRGQGSWNGVQIQKHTALERGLFAP